MSVLDIFWSFLGWCPKFNATPVQLRSGEEEYHGSKGLLASSILTGLSMIALYIASFPRVQAEGLWADNGVRTIFSLLMTGGILFLGFSRTLWKVSSVDVSISDWRNIKKVYLTSFITVIATSLVVWLCLPKALIDWNYPIIYLSYIVTNHSYARRIIRKDLQ